MRVFKTAKEIFLFYEIEIEDVQTCLGFKEAGLREVTYSKEGEKIIEDFESSKLDYYISSGVLKIGKEHIFFLQQKRDAGYKVEKINN